MELNKEELEFLEGVLEHIKEDFDMDESMEFGCITSELLEKLKVETDRLNIYEVLVKWIKNWQQNKKIIY